MKQIKSRKKKEKQKPSLEEQRKCHPLPHQKKKKTIPVYSIFQRVNWHGEAVVTIIIIIKKARKTNIKEKHINKE